MHGDCLSARKVIGDINTMTVNNEGRYLIAGKSADSYIGRLFDFNSGVLLKEYIGHSNTITAIKFSPDGDYVLTGSADS